MGVNNIVSAAMTLRRLVQATVRAGPATDARSRLDNLAVCCIGSLLTMKVYINMNLSCFCYRHLLSSQRCIHANV